MTSDFILELEYKIYILPKMDKIEKETAQFLQQGGIHPFFAQCG